MATMLCHSGLATVKTTLTVASTDRRKTVATVAELKSRADALGVTYPSKIRKADLETLIAKATQPARMSNWDRVRNYRAQTGRKNTTARQSRRIRKHDNRAMGRA